jgi:hypothetical protein
MKPLCKDMHRQAQKETDVACCDEPFNLVFVFFTPWNPGCYAIPRSCQSCSAVHLCPHSGVWRVYCCIRFNGPVVPSNLSCMQWADETRKVQDCKQCHSIELCTATNCLCSSSGFAGILLLLQTDYGAAVFLERWVTLTQKTWLPTLMPPSYFLLEACCSGSHAEKLLWSFLSGIICPCFGSFTSFHSSEYCFCQETTVSLWSSSTVSRLELPLRSTFPPAQTNNVGLLHQWLALEEQACMTPWLALTRTKVTLFLSPAGEVLKTNARNSAFCIMLHLIIKQLSCWHHLLYSGCRRWRWEWLSVLVSALPHLIFGRDDPKYAPENTNCINN